MVAMEAPSGAAMLISLDLCASHWPRVNNRGKLGKFWLSAADWGKVGSVVPWVRRLMKRPEHGGISS